MQSIGKLTALFKVASEHNVKLIEQKDQLITRVKIDNLFENIMNYKYNSGFFFEYDAEKLEKILPLCKTKCQTLTYLGLNFSDLKILFYKQQTFWE